MSHDDFGHVLRHTTEGVNALAAMLLEAGRSTPVGTLVGPLSRLAGGLRLKPTASLGMGIAVGSAAVLAISAILKARARQHAGETAPAGSADAQTAASASAASSMPPQRPRESGAASPHVAGPHTAAQETGPDPADGPSAI